MKLSKETKAVLDKWEDAIDTVMVYIILAALVIGFPAGILGVFDVPYCNDIAVWCGLVAVSAFGSMYIIWLCRHFGELIAAAKAEDAAWRRKLESKQTE